MQFLVKKNDKDGYDITPCDGPFQGAPIANAEGLEMYGVCVKPYGFVGTIDATWGLVITNENVYNCMEVLRALRINKAFTYKAQRPMTAAMTCQESGKRVYSARRVLLMGGVTYWGD